LPAAKSAAGANSASELYADTVALSARPRTQCLRLLLEHLGRAIHEGIYDPSKLSDSNGFRKDVLNEIHQLGVPSSAIRRQFRFRIQLA